MVEFVLYPCLDPNENYRKAKQKVPDAFSLQNRKYDSAEKPPIHEN